MEQVANSLLRKGHTGAGKPPTVGAHWAARFLQRHPQYVVQKQKPLARERKNALKPENFQTHFEDYRIAKAEKGIHDEDTYYYDETGLRAGLGKDQWVVIKDDTSIRLYVEDPDNQEYITLECVGDDGDVIPNMLILSAKQHLEEFLRRMIWRTVCPLLSAIRVTSMMKLGYNGLKSLMSALEEKGKEHARCYSWTELAVILTKNL